MIDQTATIIKYVFLVVIGLLPIMNPLIAIPLYMSLTQRLPDDAKRLQAKKACLYAFGILCAFLLLGNGIISLFGISMPGIRVAGGLIILVLGMQMLFGGGDGNSPTDAQAGEIKQAEIDYSFSPLAMPTLAGPGSIAVVMGFGTHIPDNNQVAGYLIVIAGVAITIGIAYAVLRSAKIIERFLGHHGMLAVTKIMGFLLTCVAVQFVASGIHDFVMDFRQ